MCTRYRSIRSLEGLRDCKIDHLILILLSLCICLSCCAIVASCGSISGCVHLNHCCLSCLRYHHCMLCLSGLCGLRYNPEKCCLLLHLHHLEYHFFHRLICCCCRYQLRLLANLLFHLQKKIHGFEEGKIRLHYLDQKETIYFHMVFWRQADSNFEENYYHHILRSCLQNPCIQEADSKPHQSTHTQVRNRKDTQAQL